MTDTLTIAALVVAVLVVAVAISFVASYRAALRVERNRADTWREMAENATRRVRIKQGLLMALLKERDEAVGKLAKFNTNRPRDGRGRYMRDAA